MNLNQKSSSILMILVGIIILLFPLMSTATLGFLTGAIVLIISLGLLIGGLLQFSTNKISSIITIILGIICLYYSYNLMFIPATVSALIGIILYIIGFVMIAFGIMNIIVSPLRVFKIFGIVTILFGIIVVILGGYLHNPEYLGYIIGLWFICSGLMSLFEDKGYIDV